jgi:peptidoglycan L-alanyl-D-glutamate endopeptidase CwlK
MRILTVHRDLLVLFKHVILDYDCSVICGYRGEEDQNKAFAEGNSQKKFPDSMHNYWPSLAIDVAPYEKTHVDWGKLQSAEFAGYVKGVADQLFRIGTITHRIRRGVDWDSDNDIDDTKFWDACHFEIIINPGEVFSHTKY